MGAHTAETDVLVIGGGPAGYGAAIRAAQYDLDVTLVEKMRFGGACLNHGCIPSKALISGTNIAHEAGEAEAIGVHADPEIDMAAMIEWKDGIVDRLTGGVEKLCKANGVSLVRGTAELQSETTAAIEGESDSHELEFSNAIIATGSQPIELPFLPFSEEGILDSKEALALTDPPDSLTIVGAGYIGMELAGVFAKLGSSVRVIELLDGVLPRYDDSLTRYVQRRGRVLGIDFHFETGVEGYDRTADNRLALHTDDGETFDADAVLVAVGRTPVTETVNLEAAGISVDESGAIPVDEELRTETPSIFAIGDVIGDPMLAHAGLSEGLHASRVIAGESSSYGDPFVPEVVFTDPEIARIGLTEDDAIAAGYDPRIGEFPFRSSGRAMTVGQTDGLVRLVADADTDRVLGGAIVGHEAAELIGEIGVALELEATLADIAGTMHAHPTMAEGIMEAAEHAHGLAIHRTNR